MVRVLHVEAFAATSHQGNPAGVVLAAEGLGDATMQDVARAVGFNETAFVLPSAAADVRIRYFTPGHEVDLCGHATVAAFVALHRDGRFPGSGPWYVTLEVRAGLLPVTVEVDAAARPVVTMAQAPAAFRAFRGDRSALATALGVTADEFAPGLPVVYGSTGLWTLVVPVRSLDAVRRMVPHNAAFPGVLTELPGASVHPFCRETIDPAAHLHARHFSSPRSGTVEDPVTGTASGVLGAYYREFISPSRGPSPLVVEQGQEVGRDGRVLVWAERDGGSYRVRTAGTGCCIGEVSVESGESLISVAGAGRGITSGLRGDSPRGW